MEGGRKTLENDMSKAKNFRKEYNNMFWLSKEVWKPRRWENTINHNFYVPPTVLATAQAWAIVGFFAECCCWILWLGDLADNWTIFGCISVCHLLLGASNDFLEKSWICWKTFVLNFWKNMLSETLKDKLEKVLLNSVESFGLKFVQGSGWVKFWVGVCLVSCWGFESWTLSLKLCLNVLNFLERCLIGSRIRRPFLKACC